MYPGRWGHLEGLRWISSLNCQGSPSKVKYVFLFCLFFICQPLKKSQKRWPRDVRVFQPIMGGTLYFCGAKTSRPTAPARCFICVKLCRSMAAAVYFLPVSFSTVQALALFSITPGTNLTRTHCIPHHSHCQLMTSNVESIMRWFFSLTLACENSRLSLFLAAGDTSSLRTYKDPIRIRTYKDPILLSLENGAIFATF